MMESTNFIALKRRKPLWISNPKGFSYSTRSWLFIPLLQISQGYVAYQRHSRGEALHNS